MVTTSQLRQASRLIQLSPRQLLQRAGILISDRGRERALQTVSGRFDLFVEGGLQ